MVFTKEDISQTMAQLMVYTDPNMLAFRIVRKLSNDRALVVKVFNPLASDFKVGSAKVWNTKDFPLERTVESWRTNVALGYMSSLSSNLCRSLHREYERGLELLYGMDPTSHFYEGV